VLKITRHLQQGGEVTIKLEGNLLAPWMSTLREACAEADRPSRCRLDLAAVAYVDTAGVQLLRDLIGEGVKIGACSSFVGELLRRVRHEKSDRQNLNL
jgi:ABC-type transporter Mla MlaB component